MQTIEDDQAFFARRAVEERQMMKETSCIVRSVHEEMVELYEARGEDAKADTAALRAILARLS